MENSEPEDQQQENESLEKITRAILIIGIILTSSFIIYDLLRPKEQYILFSLENKDGKLENYPTNVSVGEPVEYRFFIINKMNEDINVSVTVHKGDNSTRVSRINGFENSTIVDNITLFIKKDQNYSSDIISVTFDQPGDNMITGVQLNLYNATTNKYEYLEGYVVYLRLKVYNGTFSFFSFSAFGFGLKTEAGLGLRVRRPLRIQKKDKNEQRRRYALLFFRSYLCSLTSYIFNEKRITLLFARLDFWSIKQDWVNINKTCDKQKNMLMKKRKKCEFNFHQHVSFQI